MKYCKWVSLASPLLNHKVPATASASFRRLASLEVLSEKAVDLKSAKSLQMMRTVASRRGWHAHRLLIMRNVGATILTSGYPLLSKSLSYFPSLDEVEESPRQPRWTECFVKMGSTWLLEAETGLHPMSMPLLVSFMTLPTLMSVASALRSISFLTPSASPPKPSFTSLSANCKLFSFFNLLRSVSRLAI